MAIVTIDSDRCTNCGACADACPMDVLRPGDETPTIAYAVDCMTCFLCEQECPAGAIVMDPWRSWDLVMPW